MKNECILSIYVLVKHTCIFFFKQYEQLDKKRRETGASRPKEPSSEVSLVDQRLRLRHEIWIHLQDGRRTCQTTSISGGCPNIDDEELALQPSIEATIVIDLF